MLPRSRSSRLALPVAALLAASGSAQGQMPPTTQKGAREVPRTAPYDALTDNRVEVVNFNPEPASGLAFDALGRIYAVNPYASTVVRYGALSAAPELVIPTGLNPVSVAIWDPTGLPQDERVLVVCNGTHALFVHDPVDGLPLDVLKLDSEPLDIVLDHDNGWAFVSCQGANRVLKIELSTLSILKRYEIPCAQRPGPLYLDEGTLGDPTDNRVYVAATQTGNNSIPAGAGGAAAGTVIDLDGNAGGELPDEDVFRIDPFANTITSVVRGAGSLIFDLARNESSAGAPLWILSTDSNNKNPAIDTEPKLNGKLGINQLVAVPGVGGASGLTQAPQGIDLDDIDLVNAGGQYDALRSLNQARTLAILSPNSTAPGFAFVASPMTDVIGIFDPQGERLAADLTLPAEAQCYDLVASPLDEQVLAALCLGTMSIEIFFWSSSIVPVASLPLGLDPTPAQIRRGRDVFLDGQRSADARFTCATCHPRGRADQLGWRLRGHPCDEKDVMVTQSLLSIADSFPHHWRGERDLDDFRKAFAGLLGDPSDPPLTDPTEDPLAADFVAFLQSLQAHANPRQDNRRILNDAKTNGPAPNGMQGSAVNGQRPFQDVPNFNGQTCEGCHTNQSGTSGAFFAEVGSLAPRSASLEAAHLRQLEHKGLATAQVSLNGGAPFTVNENGFGAAHNGASVNVFTFIFDTVVFFALNDQERVDVFKFIQQFDQGISPASHWAIWYDSASPSSVELRVFRVLLTGARNGWNDVVAFGRYDNGDGLVPMRWWWDTSATPAVFRPEDPGFPTRTWTEFQADTQAGRAESALMGVPAANGRRFGIDHDNDGLINGQELALGSDPWDPDSDADGWHDGHELANGDDPLTPQSDSSDATGPNLAAPAELDFATSRMAKYHVRFDEDATYEVTFSIPTSARSYSFQRDYFSRQDTFVLTHDEPNSPAFPPNYVPPIASFDVQITMTDRAGITTGPVPLAPFTPTEAAVMNLAVFPAPQAHVASMEWVRQDRVGSALDAEVRIKLDLNFYQDQNVSPTPEFIPAAATMIFSTICVENLLTGDFDKSTTFTSTDATTFSFVDLQGNVSPYTIDPGPPWVVSPLTDPQGEIVVNFRQPNLAPGQRVRIIVMGTASLPDANGDFNFGSLFQLQPLFREDAAELQLEF